MTLPLAHVGHYLWILYLLPVLFVVIGIVRTVLVERRRGDSEDDPGEGR
jgi:cytochrome c-type biogenesis protein CcmH/NrfF